MKTGKRVSGSGRRNMLIVLALVLVLCAAGGTIAGLATNTNSVTNTFVPAKVENQIEETTNDGVKSNVKVTNTGDVSAYVRAAVIVNWVDSAGNIAVPPAGAAYSVEYNEGTDAKQWTNANGYWYYNSVVTPYDENSTEDTTGVLIVKAQETNAPAGYHLQVTIVAESIQAEGMGAVSAQDAWAKAAASKS